MTKTPLSLPTLAVRRPVTTAMLLLGLCLLGYYSFLRVPVQLMPDFLWPVLYVRAVLPGADPEQVERDLVIPLEGEVSRVAGVAEVSSRAEVGFGTLEVKIHPDRDLDMAFLELQERVQAASVFLPDQAQVFTTLFDTSQFANFVMRISLAGEAEPDILRRIAEQRVAPRLEGVDGVVRAWVVGGEGLSVSVEIDPERTAARGLNAFAVRNAVIAANQRRLHMGRVIQGDNRMFVAMEGGLESPMALADLQVAEGPVLLRDVAEVRLGFLMDERRERSDGLPTVSLYIMKDQTANLLAVGNRVTEAMADINRDLEPEGLAVEAIFDASDEVRDRIRQLVKLALIGGAFAVIVLLLFLKDVRSVGIIVLSMPVSILISGVGIWAAGLSIDVWTLMGMTLAVGMLVDNSIVSLEAIERHRSLGLGARHAAMVGGSEVQRAMVAATLTTAVVLLPLAWVMDEIRSLLIDFALSLIIPLLASLLVALLLVPMLAAYLLEGTNPVFLKDGTLDPARRPGAWYRAVLGWSARRPGWAIFAFLAFLLFSMVVTTPFILMSFVGQRSPADRIELALEMPSGTIIEETDRLTRELESLMGEVEGVRQVDTVVEEETSYLTLLLHEEGEEEWREVAEIRRDVDQEGKKIPRGRVVMDQSLRASAAGGDEEEQSMLGLTGSRERVLIRGADPEVLSQVATQIQERIEQIDQVQENSFRYNFDRNTGEELRILPERTALAMHGLSVQDLMQVVWSTRREVESLNVPLRWFGEDLDVAIGIKGGDERALDDLERIRMATPGGASVALAEIAEARIDRGARTIERQDRGRETALSFNFRPDRIPTDDAHEKARRAVEKALESVHMPAGTTARLDRPDPGLKIKPVLLVGIALLILVLGVTFEDFLLWAVILFTLTMAMTGVLWALAITGTAMEMTVWLGLVVLAGLVVNGSILLVDRAQSLMRENGFTRLRAALQASRDRSRPVLMTAGTTIVGLLPMALKSGVENEVWPPFAITVIGGMSFATILTLILTPAGFLLIRNLSDVVGRFPLRWLGTLAVFAAFYLPAFWPYGLLSESTLWQIFWGIVLFLGTFPVAWAASTGVRRRRRSESAVRSDGHRVDLNNATKVYGEPGRFGRALGARRLRELRRIFEGAPVWSRRGVTADLLWEVPLAAVMVWAHTWFRSGLWLFVFTWITWAVFRRLLRDLTIATGLTTRDAKQDRWAGFWMSVPMRVARTVLFAAGILYAHTRLDLPWVFDAIYVTLALAVRAVVVTGRRVREGDPLPEGTNWIARLRRWWCGLIGGIPRIGRRTERVPALRGVDLEVGDGMFGLLGPNGAGKTTLLRMVAGVLEPSRGVVRMEGLDVVRDRDLLQGRAGYLPQDSGLYDNMTARDYLDYHALLMKIEEPERRAQLVQESLEAVGLAERADEKVGGYSGGMRQRVGIARTLLDLPDILVVDEPTVGLDPAERIRFRTLLARLARERTVLFSTHVVEDVATACDRLAVMDKGRIQFLGTPQELKAAAEGSVWEVMTDEKEAARLRHQARVVHTQREQMPDGATGMKVRLLSRERPTGNATPAEPTLEDAYLLLVPPRGEAAGA